MSDDWGAAAVSFSPDGKQLRYRVARREQDRPDEPWWFPWGQKFVGFSFDFEQQVSRPIGVDDWPEPVEERFARPTLWDEGCVLIEPKLPFIYDAYMKWIYPKLSTFIKNAPYYVAETRLLWLDKASGKKVAFANPIDEYGDEDSIHTRYFPDRVAVFEHIEEPYPYGHANVRIWEMPPRQLSLVWFGCVGLFVLVLVYCFMRRRRPV